MANVFRCDKCYRYHDGGQYDKRHEATVMMLPGDQGSDESDARLRLELCRGCAGKVTTFLKQKEEYPNG